jgi:hypothetical protein
LEWKWLVTTSLNYLLGKNGAGRNLEVFPDDIFLTSYPRSGNTWTRFLVGNLMDDREPVTFLNLERRVPDIYINSHVRLHRLRPPRVLKSHEPFDPRYKKVIYIVRDPRDVVISSYHFHVKARVINEDYPLSKYISGLIAGQWWPHGSWGQHVMTWLLTRRRSRSFLMLRYEDIVEDPSRELTKIADFLRLPRTQEQIDRAVQRSSAANMRILEQQQGRQWRGTRKHRQDKPFVRAAKSGCWRTELPGESRAELESAWGSVMREAGYGPATCPPLAPAAFDWSQLVLPEVPTVPA